MHSLTKSHFVSSSEQLCSEQVHLGFRPIYAYARADFIGSRIQIALDQKRLGIQQANHLNLAVSCDMFKPNRGCVAAQHGETCQRLF